MAKFKDDKYYASEETIKEVINPLNDIILFIKQYIDEYIEPSAGAGAFMNALKKFNKPCVFMDLKPEHPEIIEQDFLKYEVKDDKNRVFVGGPPFSEKLFYKFLDNCKNNKANIIAFICPASAYNNLYFKSKYRLIYSKYLGPTIFYSNKNEEHIVSVCINIWVRDEEFIPIKTCLDKQIKKDFLITLNNKLNEKPQKHDYYFNTWMKPGKLTNYEDLKSTIKYIGVKVLNDKLKKDFYFFAEDFYNTNINKIKEKSTSIPYINKKMFIEYIKNTFYRYRCNFNKLDISEKEKFLIRHEKLINLGVIKFETLFGKKIIVLDRFDEMYKIFLCEKNDIIQARTDIIKKLGYKPFFGIGTYIKMDD